MLAHAAESRKWTRMSLARVRISLRIVSALRISEPPPAGFPLLPSDLELEATMGGLGSVLYVLQSYPR